MENLSQMLENLSKQVDKVKKKVQEERLQYDTTDYDDEGDTTGAAAATRTQQSLSNTMRLFCLYSAAYFP